MHMKIFYRLVKSLLEKSPFVNIATRRSISIYFLPFLIRKFSLSYALSFNLIEK